jgi:hypothetical protein
MKPSITTGFERSEVRDLKQSEYNKKRKNYAEKLLHFLSRETNSEKRANLFGSDPFK